MISVLAKRGRGSIADCATEQVTRCHPCSRVVAYPITVAFPYASRFVSAYPRGLRIPAPHSSHIYCCVNSPLLTTVLLLIALSNDTLNMVAHHAGERYARHCDPACVHAHQVLIENKSKFVLVHASSGHKRAVEDILSQPAVQARLADTKASEEIRALGTFFDMLKKDPERAYYGYNVSFCFCVMAYGAFRNNHKMRVMALLSDLV